MLDRETFRGEGMINAENIGSLFDEWAEYIIKGLIAESSLWNGAPSTGNSVRSFCCIEKRSSICQCPRWRRRRKGPLFNW